jgi:uncharacterized protein YqeY
MINIDELIQNCMKEVASCKSKNEINDMQKAEQRLVTLRNIKTAFTAYTTAKNAKELDEIAQFNIIKKMISQNEESISMFKKANRDDLISIATVEIGILKSFIPDVPDLSQIENCYMDWRKNVESEFEYPSINRKEMGTAIKAIKASLPLADGKMVSDIVKKYII